MQLIDFDSQVRLLKGTDKATTLRDLASPLLQAVEWRARERRGEPGLPRIFATGPVLDSLDQAGIDVRTPQ